MGNLCSSNSERVDKKEDGRLPEKAKDGEDEALLSKTDVGLLTGSAEPGGSGRGALLAGANGKVLENGQCLVAGVRSGCPEIVVSSSDVEMVDEEEEDDDDFLNSVIAVSMDAAKRATTGVEDGISAETECQSQSEEAVASPDVGVGAMLQHEDGCRNDVVYAHDTSAASDLRNEDTDTPSSPAATWSSNVKMSSTAADQVTVSGSEFPIDSHHSEIARPDDKVSVCAYGETCNNSVRESSRSVEVIDGASSEGCCEVVQEVEKRGMHDVVLPSAGLSTTNLQTDEIGENKTAEENKMAVLGQLTAGAEHFSRGVGDLIMDVGWCQVSGGQDGGQQEKITLREVSCSQKQLEEMQRDFAVNIIGDVQCPGTSGGDGEIHGEGGETTVNAHDDFPWDKEWPDNSGEKPIPMFTDTQSSVVGGVGHSVPEGVYQSEGKAGSLTERTEDFTERAEKFTEIVEAFTDRTEVFTEAVEAFTGGTGAFTEAAEAFTERAETFTEMAEDFTESAEDIILIKNNRDEESAHYCKVDSSRSHDVLPSGVSSRDSQEPGTGDVDFVKTSANELTNGSGHRREVIEVGQSDVGVVESEKSVESCGGDDFRSKLNGASEGGDNSPNPEFVVVQPLDEGCGCPAHTEAVGSNPQSARNKVLIEEASTAGAKQEVDESKKVEVREDRGVEVDEEETAQVEKNHGEESFSLIPLPPQTIIVRQAFMGATTHQPDISRHSTNENSHFADAGVFSVEDSNHETAARDIVESIIAKAVLIVSGTNTESVVPGSKAESAVSGTNAESVVPVINAESAVSGTNAESAVFGTNTVRAIDDSDLVFVDREEETLEDTQRGIFSRQTSDTSTSSVFSPPPVLGTGTSQYHRSESSTSSISQGDLIEREELLITSSITDKVLNNSDDNTLIVGSRGDNNNDDNGRCDNVDEQFKEAARDITDESVGSRGDNDYCKGRCDDDDDDGDESIKEAAWDITDKAVQEAIKIVAENGYHHNLELNHILKSNPDHAVNADASQEQTVSDENHNMEVHKHTLTNTMKSLPGIDLQTSMTSDHGVSPEPEITNTTISLPGVDLQTSMASNHGLSQEPEITTEMDSRNHSPPETEHQTRNGHTSTQSEPAAECDTDLSISSSSVAPNAGPGDPGAHSRTCVSYSSKVPLVASPLDIVPSRPDQPLIVIDSPDSAALTGSMEDLSMAHEEALI